jgi:hypothetical protein
VTHPAAPRITLRCTGGRVYPAIHYSRESLTPGSHSLPGVTHSQESLTPRSHSLPGVTHSRESLTPGSHSLPGSLLTPGSHSLPGVRRSGQSNDSGMEGISRFTDSAYSPNRRAHRYLEVQISHYESSTANNNYFAYLYT